MAEIHERLSRVMAEVGAIGKGQTNTFDKYKFRGIDDVYNSVHPALVKHGVVVCPEVLECHMDEFQTSKGATQQRCIVKVAHHFYAPDGSSLTVTTMGEGADRGDKSVNKAHSSAYKTAFLQALCIPTEEAKDSEHDSPDLSGGKTTRKPRRVSGKKANGPQERTRDENPNGLTVEDRKKIGECIIARCEELGLDVKNHVPICRADVLRAVGHDDPVDVPREKLNDLLQHVSHWQPQDADDFNQDLGGEAA